MENLAKPEVKFGEWIGEGWRMFTSQWKGWVMNSLVYMLICVAPIMVVVIAFYINIIMQVSTNARSAQPINPGSILIFYLLFGVVGLLTFFTSAFFTVGMHRSALKQLRGGRVELRDLFSGGDVYFRMLGSMLLGALLTMIGAMLCFFPAYIVAGMIFFTAPLIVDRKLGVVQAMQTSYELAKRNWLMFTLFAFVVQLLASLGVYACYVGILATLPLLFTITAVAYRDCFGIEGAQYFSPSAPQAPSDYGQSYPQGYQQPPSAIYGQQGYEPPAPGTYNQPLGYPPPPPQNEPTAQNPFAPPPVVEAPPPPIYPPPVSEPRPVNIEPQPATAEPPKPAPGIVEAAPKMNCPSCNASLPVTAAFCPRCGNRIVK